MSGAGSAACDLAMVAPAERLRGWLESAAPGDQARYAVGGELPRDCETVRMVSRWREEGLVRTHLTRDRADPSRTVFLVVKRGAEEAAPGGVRHAVPPAERKAMLAALEDYAERGRACPSNAALARQLGLRTRMQAKYQIERLAADGLIRVENRGPKLPRVVTIVRTGKETGRG